ncbi:MAG: TIGR03960 family B12-binding radical SAM protein [Nitrospirota bacterium]
MYEDFLPLVTKPGRYINTEINAVHKDLSQVATKVCLFFPDAYEVGMSHLGLRILYHILNGRPDTACERVFSPWPDYEQRLRASGRPLKSLESGLPLAGFDIIGVTLQYELSYSNIAAGLELSGIPSRSADRNDGHPVVVAGGPCAVNPEPLSDFIDVFFIGEAEEAVHELIETRQAERTRAGFLEAISKREGFYVPALGKSSVRRRFLRDLETAPYPDRPIVPLMKPIHDRVSVEVARGCIRGCRFCQAGIIYRPYRERSAGRIKGLLDESLACTGYDELSLASLSSGDHSGIQPLVIELMKKYRESRVSVSLPSLRVGTLTPEMIEAIAGTRKTGFTLAPEAGTERLRRVINKPVSHQDLLEAAQTVFKNGWSLLKLYFMIGLPTETDEDLDGIIRIANELLAVGKRVSRRHVQLNISVSTFVPKPHTPFQWMGQVPMEEVRRKQAYLGTGLKRRGIALKVHDPETSLLEAAFARGDRALGGVIAEAARLGCRFDGWTEWFDFRKWTDAFAKCGIDLAGLASRTYGLTDELPWDFVRSGVTKEFLKHEYRRASASEITDNCREDCGHCGIGCRDGGTASFGKPEEAAAAPARERPAPGRVRQAAHPEMTARIRMRYARTGRVRFLSHLDFMTLVHRAAVRSGIPLAWSQGFNPHPRIAFGPALPVGMESETEYLDLETDPFADLLRMTKDLNAVLPEGVRIRESAVVPKKAPSLSGSIARYRYRLAVPGKYQDGLEPRVEEFLSRSSVPVSREGKQRDIRPCIETIESAEGADGCLTITLIDHGEIKPRIYDVIEQLFGIGPEESPLFPVTRTGLFYRDGDRWKDPMDVM